MKQSPIIGVTPLWDAERKSVWMLPDYLDGIRAAGGLPVILPIEMAEDDAERIVDTCDGFLFTGGQDVTPELYGAKDAPSIISSQERDKLETLLLSKALQFDKAILGICRGLQFINVFLGGRSGRIFPRSILRRLSTDKANLTVPQLIKSYRTECSRRCWAKKSLK